MTAIVIQTFIAAPPETIWAALLSRTDVLFDGLPARAWPARTGEQPPFHFKTAWPFTESAGGATDVAVTLHTLGGGTRVDVRHEGWGEGPAWDAAIQGHFAGWLQGLAALGLLIESGVDARASESAVRGRGRYFVSGEIAADAAPVYRALVDPAVLARWSDGVFDGIARTQEIENRLVRWRSPSGSGGAGDAGGEVVAILRPTPRGTHVALAEYGVSGTEASARWPQMFERLAQFLG
ncbi:MAG: SRPBCC domain-containing protein [Gemmatimonadales bacterium]